MKKYITLILIASSFYSFGQKGIKKQIDSVLDEAVKGNSGPGLTVGVVENGKIKYHNSRGYMNLEYDIPFNDSTVIGLASVTKQFTSACVAILEKQGKLSISDDIRKYIPELAFYGDTIRIMHLLNHTSGIRNHNVLLDLSGFDFTHQGYTNESIEKLMFQQKGVNNRPGEKMLYSNTNYVLLALLVKRVAGLPIHTFAKQEIFEPLGMTNTFYQDDLTKVVKNRAYSYYRAGDAYKQEKSVTLCVGAGGIESTVQDLAKWSQVFLNPEHTYAFISDFVTTLDTLNSGTVMKHGRGMFVSPYKGYKTFNHSGRGLGMRSQLICVPDLDLSVIVYSNASHINAVDVSYKILDLWIHEPPSKEKAKKKYRHNKKELVKFTGTYQELNSDMGMRIFIQNDTLFAQSSFGRHPVPLSSKSANTFTRLENPSVSYIFSSNEGSDVDLRVDFGGAIFYLERVELAENPNLNVEEFAGKYFSEELDVIYELVISDNKLILNYPNNQGIVLSEGERDVFGSNKRTKYTFIRGENDMVTSFEVASEGTVKGVIFNKIN